MKTLILIRHAKSGWDDASLKDIERTLTDRGKSDAAMMAGRLIKKSIGIDAFVSSPAKRAKETAMIFMDEYRANRKELTLAPSLYEAPVKHFYDVINSLDDGDDVVAIFAHNPGIAEFVNSLECSPVYNMPACAVYGLTIKTNRWKEFDNAKKKFLFFDYPQNET